MPSSIFRAETQIISMLIPYMINVITGIINVITLLVNSMVPVNSLLALSNLSSSFFSRPKARITEIPVRISLDTRFTLSTSFCIALNLGMAIAIRSPTKPIITTNARAIIQPIPAPVLYTLITPPTPIIGAYATTLKSMTVTI